MSSVRVAWVRLHAFRGAPQGVTLNLTKAEKAVSCLLLGDNGTGKSSFVDAIEFALRGRVSPLFSRTRKNFGRIGNLLDPEARSCYCEIELSDGTTHARTITKSDDGSGKWTITPEGSMQGFDAANFVLRREDIVTFAQLPADQRTQLFATFLRGVTDKIASQRPRDVSEVAVLNGELEAIKSDQRNIIDEIGGLLQVDPTQIELFHPGALDSLFVDRGIIRRYATVRYGRRRGRTPQADRLLNLRRAYKRNHKEWSHKKQLATGWHRERRKQDIHEIVLRLEGSVSASFREYHQSGTLLSLSKLLRILLPEGFCSKRSFQTDGLFR